jgi:hypothetical protein
MASDFALQPLLDLAGRRLEAATAELQRLAALRQQAEDSLAQLQSRQAEYLTGLQRALARGIEPTPARDYRAFLSRLERAIGLRQSGARRRAWAERMRAGSSCGAGNGRSRCSSSATTGPKRCAKAGASSAGRMNSPSGRRAMRRSRMLRSKARCRAEALCLI